MQEARVNCHQSRTGFKLEAEAGRKVNTASTAQMQYTASDTAKCPEGVNSKGKQLHEAESE